MAFKLRDKVTFFPDYKENEVLEIVAIFETMSNDIIYGTGSSVHNSLKFMKFGTLQELIDLMQGTVQIKDLNFLIGCDYSSFYVCLPRHLRAGDITERLNQGELCPNCCSDDICYINCGNYCNTCGNRNWT